MAVLCCESGVAGVAEVGVGANTDGEAGDVVVCVVAEAVVAVVVAVVAAAVADCFAVGQLAVEHPLGAGKASLVEEATHP